MIFEEGAYLEHYGILRKSGRYPWGSGNSQEQRNRDFLGYLDSLASQGLSPTDVARAAGITTTEMRAARSIAKNAEKQAQINMAQRLRDRGNSNVAIGERMGIPESTVRTLLAPGAADKAGVLLATAGMLKNEVDSKQFVDIGTGAELHTNVSRTKLDQAVAVLKEQGYEVHNVQIDQLGTNNKTTVKVLTPPGTKYLDVKNNLANIKPINEYSTDGGRTYEHILPPMPISSKRVDIVYGEEGAKADGLMYVRPGVEDVSLGRSRYAQVRVLVDGTHYIKGMAIYKDDLPDGVDIQFNTNKSKTANKLDALKPVKGDPEDPNPFGATFRQLTKPNADGTRSLTSAMNLVNEEGSWENWSRNLSTQMLSKQSPRLAKTQLDMTYENTKSDLDSILKLTNPAVRKVLLEKYADGADASAVHLKAAAMPRQNSHVIIPVSKMKPNEIYAPRYKDGERVVLIRYPHGGTFEIPELTVNNRQRDAKKLLGNAPDAVGIHHNVAKKLSGADFDGDTVLVIPNNSGSIKTKATLEKLKDFDPQRAYPEYPGMKRMTPHAKGFAMGDVSNLITDMTIKGATDDELARAVRHSMVVIDAEKHGLNWKQSAIDNGIADLKTKYQKGPGSGADTLISKATSRTDVLKRKPRPAEQGGPIDRVTGKKVFVPTGESWVDKNGRTVFRTQRSTKLAEADDAHSLSSGTVIESVYADHSNRLKALADIARREAVNTRPVPYSPSAKATYAKEVATLNANLNLALRNRPLERQAQVIANAAVQAKRQANPDMDSDDVKKLKARELTEARIRTGASKQQIPISNEEWKAIQAGAITNNKLEEILKNADIDRVRELATPRVNSVMTDVRMTRAKAMASAGYTPADIAEALGVSVSTLRSALTSEEEG